MSIVVPVLNDEDSIEKFLGVLNLSNMYYREVILVDGGSTDKTREKATRYPKVKWVVYTEGRVYGARNYGASLAKSDYLLFLDSDTLVYPEMFREIFKGMKNKVDCLATTDTPISGCLVKIQCYGYNLLRLLLARLKLRFFTTGNFILIRNRVFRNIGGFEIDINGDGRLGRKMITSSFCYSLLNCYRYVYVSGRFATSSVLQLNRHYFYATIENFFPLCLKLPFFRNIRDGLQLVYFQKMREW